jgi:trehalose-6-phosphatase
MGPEFVPYVAPLRDFVLSEWERSLRHLGVRIEDKGVMMTFHWRGLANPEACELAVQEVAERARNTKVITSSGEIGHWITVGGEMNLEIRPPIPLTKKDAFKRSVGERRWRGAVIFGDEISDLHALDGAEELREANALDQVLFVGVRSDHTPAGMERRADLMVPGVRGVTRVLAHLGSAPVVA